ncbi:hypothetical protein QRX50_37650 [Amycolatopsis carbonis]|uniref:Uncharacterized protein n=1 Tax=Amycolatopsis carbonis TaxID=715471 RepID=A0A9Y2IC88_9PSEU|nr:hypothetical protein [Amycolatopsis sp. 2-15]WIX77087.1 hypothetical protein QRX50_37650 [Amycolatopsis sp. 2-15]
MRGAVSAGLAALLGVVGAQPAGAAGSAYAAWDLRSGEGSVTVPVAGFPAGAFSTDTTSAVATSGGTRTSRRTRRSDASSAARAAGPTW